MDKEKEGTVTKVHLATHPTLSSPSTAKPSTKRPAPTMAHPSKTDSVWFSLTEMIMAMDKIWVPHVHKLCMFNPAPSTISTAIGWQVSPSLQMEGSLLARRQHMYPTTLCVRLTPLHPLPILKLARHSHVHQLGLYSGRATVI